jgi:hypothetical protein
VRCRAIIIRERRKTMKIEIKMVGADDTAIHAVLKTLKKIESNPAHYIGCQEFSIVFGGEE